MPDLSFQVESVEAQQFAAAPLLIFKLRITNALPEEPIHTAILRCQIRIEPAARSYPPESRERLLDLFGTPDRWSQTLRSMLWTHTTVTMRAFAGTVLVDLPVPCTYDFNVAATKYFHALDDGEVPLVLLFSGTVFYQAEEGALQVAQIPWEKETSYRLPVGVWKKMMDLYYPSSAWLCLRKDVFDRLYRYKVGRGLPSWEQALEELLVAAKEPVKP